MTRVVISVTSIPPRFAGLGDVLATLLAQSDVTAEIVLNIPTAYRRFPDWDGRLPTLPGGVKINRCRDFGPACKILPTLRQWTGDADYVLYGDDDVLYGDTWARDILEAADQRPGAAIAGSGFDLHRLGAQGSTQTPRGDGAPEGWVDIAQGFAGVAVRPEWFPKEAVTPPPEAFPVDDIWLSCMLSLSRIPIWKTPVSLSTLDRPAPLQTARQNGIDRDAANRACLAYLQNHFGIWT